MRQVNLKKIIKEELKDILKSENALYVFDFDDTLVTDTATVYVEKEGSPKRKALTPHEFHNYEIQPGETLNYDEFEEVGDPKVHNSIMTLLKKHLDNSVILTARSRAKPVKDYLASVGVDVPHVIAVGTQADEKDSVMINAKRKRDWIDKAIQSRGLDYVEFWDDNEHNIENVWSLQKKYPDVKIVCHLVRH